jgi:hypothetical protein
VQRHELDPLALVAGAIFTVFGLAYAIGRWNWFDFGGAWVLALVLIAVGLAGVVTASSRRTPRPRNEPSANGSATDRAPA